MSGQIHAGVDGLLVTSFHNVVSKKLESAIRAAAEAVISAEPEITRCDTVLGDGDCGTTLKAAACGKLCSSP